MFSQVVIFGEGEGGHFLSRESDIPQNAILGDGHFFLRVVCDTNVRRAIPLRVHVVGIIAPKRANRRYGAGGESIGAFGYAE